MVTRTVDLRHPAVDAVLSTAASLLGMEVVYIGGLTEETFTFERVLTQTDWPAVFEGGSFQRTDSVCNAMLAGAPAATSDLGADPGFDGIMPSRQVAVDQGVTSYVGVPILDAQGALIGTLCGLDRGSVPVPEETVAVLRQLATVVAAQLGPLVEEGVVIRRAPTGGWQVSGDEVGDDLTSAMVLADLIANDVGPGARPARSEAPLDELGQLRLSITQLEHALAARVVVEQAIGVLTERQHHTPREAFERLRKVSRARGRKVHDLAREVVMSATDHSVPLPPELAGRR
jgi:hypothetical protein